VPNPLGSPLDRVRLSLVVQAAVSGAFAVGPLSTGSFVPDRWLSLVAGSAAGALVLAGFVSSRTRSAWTMALGFELLAVVVGAAGLADGRWFPGSIWAALVLLQLVLPSGRATFPTTPAATTTPVRLTPPPPVVPARPAPPAVPPPGLLVNASMPPPPSFPPPPGFLPPGRSSF
jgi:hypothetical protein